LNLLKPCSPKAQLLQYRLRTFFTFLGRSELPLITPLSMQPICLQEGNLIFFNFMLFVIVRAGRPENINFSRKKFCSICQVFNVQHKNLPLLQDVHRTTWGNERFSIEVLFTMAHILTSRAPENSLTICGSVNCSWITRPPAVVITGAPWHISTSSSTDPMTVISLQVELLCWISQSGQRFLRKAISLGGISGLFFTTIIDSTSSNFTNSGNSRTCNRALFTIVMAGCPSLQGRTSR
uniref:NR LBD domain-containing protein n=1 Tax=Haemonchus placei TaxID=6290 RepID=A0A158QPP6_HAEPC